ncbi:type I DNA topoisomerase [Suttonella ornithocola]|uniref:DNA topoisomerase 1 n=1 Tax=Suttonella ornithocola TaxID=279832 RepID=A0A380MXK4_9GAMM|nr:type I DNA topoisomerase [Suttonella ornithocola]SUO96167.1 DNA topoisomerase 1 [Suttonella ornithocola]
MKLLIVESPAKTKKIAHYLGKDWRVEASFGHIRDMPVKEIGVTAPDYQPVYEVSESKKNQVARLKALAKEADEIWLATDPDREGEVIAWHLNEVLKSKKPTYRVTFNEITETAVKKAIQNSRNIDINLVKAQEGRRVLDRLYGYKLSPALAEKLDRWGVSAGRVQSVALRLIVDREQSIHDFKITKHFGVTANFETDGIAWQAKWKTKDLVSEDNPYILDKRIAEKVQQAAKEGLILIDFEEKEQSRKAPAPLITSTLQQAAANKLNMSVGDTMKAAQKLFEAGLITYMRTDNPNLSDDAIAAIKIFMTSVNQEEHLSDKPNTWKAKDGAQEAHEAIRPTDFKVREATNLGDEAANRLYKVIWRAAIASQMKPARYKVRTATLKTLKEIDLHSETYASFDASSKTLNAIQAYALFEAKGSERIYAGWQMLMQDDYTNEDSETAETLPMLSKNETYHPNDTQVIELETRPPKRYSETSLVKALEKESIGRPSTYASIIETLKKREYVILQKKVFTPTELGVKIVKALINRFDMMELAYTAQMEEQLDAIAHGSATYLEVVSHYDNELEKQLKSFQQSTISGLSIETAQHTCPKCKTGNLKRLKGKNGAFWACSNYDSGKGCAYTAPDNKGKPEERQKCPKCKDGFLVKRPSKKKPNKFWYGCDQYPQCDYKSFD